MCRGSKLGTQEKIVEESGTYIDTFPNCKCIVTYQVTAVDAPALQVSPSSEYLCPGASITFSASAGFDHYSWSTGDTSATTSLDTIGHVSLRTVDRSGCEMLV
jgi:hypothetical protein